MKYENRTSKHLARSHKLKSAMSVPESVFTEKYLRSVSFVVLKRTFDIALVVLGVAVVALFTTRYRMPFRLDDILLMEWSLTHHWWDAFDPIKGQLVNSYRPMFAMAAWSLTHVAGWAHPFWWHLKLCSTLIIGLGFVGMTARYIAGRWYALDISVPLYPIALATILNVFFWYSDLTYGLE